MSSHFRHSWMGSNALLPAGDWSDTQAEGASLYTTRQADVCSQAISRKVNLAISIL